MKLRPPREDEAAAVAALMSAEEPEPTTEAEVRRWWSSPAIRVERDARVAVDEAGRVVGSVVVEDLEGKGERFWADVYGASGTLLAWAEQRAGRGRVLSGSWSAHEPTKRALAAAGFRVVRRSYRMAIDLAEAGEPPRWPQAIAVRTFEPDDAAAVHAAHMETFHDHWEHVEAPYEEWAHWFLQRDDFDASLWFLAEADGELAGIALCRQDESDARLGWVAILGVRQSWRRRGLGRALLLRAFEEFRRRDYRRVVLGVDADSLTGAHRLYESAGMRVLHSYDIYEKALP